MTAGRAGRTDRPGPRPIAERKKRRFSLAFGVTDKRQPTPTATSRPTHERPTTIRTSAAASQRHKSSSMSMSMVGRGRARALRAPDDDDESWAAAARSGPVGIANPHPGPPGMKRLDDPARRRVCGLSSAAARALVAVLMAPLCLLAPAMSTRLGRSRAFSISSPCS